MQNWMFGIAALAALAYLPLAGRPVGMVRSLLKTGSVALLALGAITGGAPLLALALALCALGDWFLSRAGDRAFLAGVAAFAAGHIAYMVLFLSRPASDPAALAGPPGLWIAAGLVLVSICLAPALMARAGALRGPVLGYMPIILGMGMAALTLPMQGATALVVPAALSFIVSDMILATDRFLLPGDHSARRLAPYAIWITYWGAQAGFYLAFT